jgi:hypothetical protein
MYYELLTASLADVMLAARRPVAALVSDAVDRRLALRSGSADAASGVAVQLAYDLALLRLCRALDEPADPVGFTRPLLERHRLEARLVDRGVDLAALAGNGTATVPAR